MFGFGKKEIELTPKLALVVGSIYMVGADGELADEEMGQLISMFGGDEDLIQEGIDYIEQNNNVQETISKTAEMLNQEQKEVMIINLLDILLSDGEADENEKELFFAFSNAFGFEQNQIELYFDVISKKNNLAIFN
jgi:uncharacterized tellurite resistance protein B-like protein